MFRVTRYPMISKTESGRVSKEMPGSGSGSGTRWALLLMPLMALQMRLMMLLLPLLMPNHDTLAPLGAACAKVGVYKSCNRDTWQDAPTHQHLPGHFLAICNPWGSLGHLLGV